jgi:hypothetical protein
VAVPKPSMNAALPLDGAFAQLSILYTKSNGQPSMSAKRGAACRS